MSIGASNKVILDRDGLVVGDNQLATTGGGVYIKRNLVVDGNIYVTGNISGRFFEGEATRLGGQTGVSFPILISQGGTSATTATAALNNLGGITAGKAAALTLIFR
ncbi:MAG: hypothetical protein EBU90_19740 [Proteobacteria bacterium]|nr:hypothetical protein [Pseudomonadota bacterium]NBP15745.1 hypothetical protein [bacterium]